MEGDRTEIPRNWVEGCLLGKKGRSRCFRGVLYRGSRREITWDRVEDFWERKKDQDGEKVFLYKKQKKDVGMGRKDGPCSCGGL